MPGGGPFRLNPGQITDDSELAMCIMRGLVDNKKPNTIDVEKICHWYK